MEAGVEKAVLAIEGGKDLEVSVMNAEGRLTIARTEQHAMLGKRYICGQPQNNGICLTGSIHSDGGREIYAGCGTTTLCTKPGEGGAVPYCCGTPMALMQPRKLASSD